MKYTFFGSLISILLLLQQSYCYNNTPSIPERHPGWKEGKGRLLINVELFFCLLCDGCADLHPEFQKFLNMTYLGSPVRDQITVNYAFFGLPYHHGSWIPHRLLPFIIDECLETQKCKFNDYINYTFGMRDSFLQGSGTSFDDLTWWWIN
jgi:hypothetical protein